MSKKKKINLIVIAVAAVFIIGIFVLIRVDAAKTRDKMNIIREQGQKGYNDWLNK